MIYLVALLAGLGGAYIGAAIGLAPFALAFEILRELDRDSLLDSKGAAALFASSFAALGFATALTLAWSWRSPAGRAPSWWKTLTIAVLAGTGATAIVFMADVTGLLERTFRLAELGEVLVVFIAISIVALIAGAALAVLSLGGASSRWTRIAAISFASVGAFAAVMGGLMADKRFGGHYPALGSNSREALVEIRMPPEMERGDSTLRVALRTPSGTTPAQENYWFRQGDHAIMRTRVDMSERTRERALLVSLDGRPGVVVPMHFPSNPRIMFDYGPWQPLGPDDTMAIRILTR